MLYLIMGWGMLGLGYAYAHNLSDTVMLLLLAGEAAYSCGAFVHTREQLPFHNVAWHALVLLGAGLHWTAIANQSVDWRGP